MGFSQGNLQIVLKITNMNKGGAALQVAPKKQAAAKRFTITDMIMGGETHESVCKALSRESDCFYDY